VRRRTAVVLGLALAAVAAVIAAVAVGGGSHATALPSELRALDAETSQPGPEAVASLARGGLNALLVDSRSGALAAAAKRAKLLVLTPVHARSAAAAADHNGIDAGESAIDSPWQTAHRSSFPSFCTRCSSACSRGELPACCGAYARGAAIENDRATRCEITLPSPPKLAAASAS